MDVHDRDVGAALWVGDSEPSRSPWNDNFEFSKWTLFGWTGSLVLVVREEEAAPADGVGEKQRLGGLVAEDLHLHLVAVELHRDQELALGGPMCI